ncbi:MAG TPA: SRPBCC family protein [Candidatus Saccharimonadales bacterium]|nr:SRPBCC family protein [Candidatus Saccharimonadales bacterium]
MTTPVATRTIQTYRVYIKATPEAVWDGLTRPEWTVKYGYAPLVDYDLRLGGAYRAHPNDGMKAMGITGVIVDGEVIEVDPPRRLVQTWRMLMEPSLAAEGFTRLTYDIEPVRGGVTRVTVTHDVTDAPGVAALVAGEHEPRGAGGGWNEVLSGLKTLLETGTPLPFQSGPNR